MPLLHRKHAAAPPPPGPPPASGYRPTTGGSKPVFHPGCCDICDTDLRSRPGRLLSAAEFRRLVQHGYNPYTRDPGRTPAALIGTIIETGISDDEFYQIWRREAMVEDHADWALCDACFMDIAAFMLTCWPGPPPGG